LNPVGRIYYAGQTMGCISTSLSQEVGAALGAEAGEAKLREVITADGFRNIRRAAETPFNMILEAKPQSGEVRPASANQWRGKEMIGSHPTEPIPTNTANGRYGHAPSVSPVLANGRFGSN
jgi:hypothetical protein